MYLNDLLKICLLAVESRYPTSVIEVNKAVLGHLRFLVEPCSPHQALEVLRVQAPQLLEEDAYLVMDTQSSDIYLVNQSQDQPALWVYRGGCSLAQHAKWQASSHHHVAASV